MNKTINTTIEDYDTSLLDSDEELDAFIATLGSPEDIENLIVRFLCSTLPGADEEAPCTPAALEVALTLYVTGALVSQGLDIDTAVDMLDRPHRFKTALTDEGVLTVDLVFEDDNDD